MFQPLKDPSLYGQKTVRYFSLNIFYVSQKKKNHKDSEEHEVE